jgi:hypothetical protein
MSSILIIQSHKHYKDHLLDKLNHSKTVIRTGKPNFSILSQVHSRRKRLNKTFTIKWFAKSWRRSEYMRACKRFSEIMKIMIKIASASEARDQGEGHTELAKGASWEPNALLLRPCKWPCSIECKSHALRRSSDKNHPAKGLHTKAVHKELVNLLSSINSA